MAKNCAVFLRVLEYYSGVIILTTNRVGEFDEAFRSRIHASLYYPKLDQVSTSKIWERNLLRLKNDFPIDFDANEIRHFYEKHWRDTEDKPTRRWNGRQIKNAFQTALALANWDFHEQNKKHNLQRPFLRVEHLERVANTSADFDDYIGSIHNIIGDSAYSVLAERAEVRKDNHPGSFPGRQNDLDAVPRRRRGSPPRRGFAARTDKTGMTRSSNQEVVDNGDDDDDDEEQLELKLKLARLKKQKQRQGHDKEETQAQEAEEDDDHW